MHKRGGYGNKAMKQYFGTSAERIAYPTEDLIAGEEWYEDDGTKMTGAYYWNGNAWIIYMQPTIV